MRQVLILGAGGHGQVVADILLSARRFGAPEVPIGFLDDDEHLSGTNILGLPVLGTIAQLPKVKHDGVIIAIGDNLTRQRMFFALSKQGVQFVNAVHPAATIAPDVRLGIGVMVCAGAIINTGSAVGNCVILNTGCTIDHHNRVREYAHIAPGVNLGGNVVVGEGCLIGIGSAIIPGHAVGAWAVVGAGSVVTKDIPPRCVAVGAPAKVIKGVRRCEE